MGVGVGEVVNYTNTTSGTAIGVVDSTSVGGQYTYVTFSSAFSPASLFAAGEQGAWYDPSDLTTLFQDSAGTTPVTLSPMEQPVGLMLDKSKGLALGAELVTNGDFSNGTTGWTVTANGSVVAGEAVCVADGTGNIFSRNITTVVGKTYLLSANLRASGATPFVGFGDLNILTIESLNTIKSGFFTAISTTTQLRFGTPANNNGLLAYADNISVKEIAGNHAFQATALNRPLLSARVNLLTYTEDFSNAAWNKVYTTTTVNTITTTLGGGSVIQDIPSYASIIKFSVLFKVQKTVGETKFPMFSLGLTGGTGTYGQVILNTNTGVATKRSNSGPDNLPTDIFSIDKTTYWQLSYNVESSTGNIAGNVTVYPAASIDGTTYNGGLVGSVTVLGADIRPTNSGALLPPYQRVTTISDYDTAGFPLYLKCNGLQSSMSTNTIDYTTTSTTKIAIIVGFRSEVGGSICLIESSNNGFTFVGGYNIGQGVVTGNSGIGFLNYGSGAETAVQTVPYVNVSSLLLDVQATPLENRGKIRINSIYQALPNVSGSANSAGSIANYPLYLFARNGNQYLLKGNFYGAVIRGATTDTAALTSTENYMAQKTGIIF